MFDYQFASRHDLLQNGFSVPKKFIIFRDKSQSEKIVKSLNLTIPPRDANHKDPKVYLQSIFGQWLPLSKAVLGLFGLLFLVL